VTQFGSNAVLAAFILFCRIGGCLMLMPGYSSERVPTNIRLFIAIAVTLALMPSLGDDVETSFLNTTPMALLRVICSELAIGGMIGFLARIFFGALETLGTAMANATGLTSPLGGPADDAAQLPTIASLISLAATALFFIMDQHLEVLRALAASYGAMPIRDGFPVSFSLSQVIDTFSKSFMLSLRISSPFIIYSVVINFAIGLAGKLTPQIPVFFVLTPAVLGLGMFLLYFTAPQLLSLFMLGFSGWLSAG
jgi:flagellar biosynthetic protein FliR